jgi:predicted permease
MANSFAASFLGAIQAALSVLLTIFYGVLAGQLGIVDQDSSSDISKLCVDLFLPALLFTKIGEEFHLDTIGLYVPIIIWSFMTITISMLLGLGLKRLFKLPDWTVVAICFNNTTSFPLLLIQTLETTGILENLLKSSSDSASAAVERAYSFLLINSLICNVLTFTLGPKLIGGDNDNQDEEEDDSTHEPGSTNGAAENSNSEQNGQAQENSNETTSLLPKHVLRARDAIGKHGYKHGKKGWDRMSPWAQNVLQFFYAFFTPAMAGGVLGAIVGLVPPFHKAFFGEANEGGFLNAWLTTSIKNLGDLFAALQVVVAGVKLSSCLRKMRRGEQAGHIPWPGATMVLVIRFIIWPV